MSYIEIENHNNKLFIRNQKEKKKKKLKILKVAALRPVERESQSLVFYSIPPFFKKKFMKNAVLNKTTEF